MGTRGTIGFRIDGKDYLTYNHFDSYPDGLGVDVLDEIKGIFKNYSMDEIKNNITSLIPVDSDNSPSLEDAIKYRIFSNASVGNQGIDNKQIHTWYQLLREAQGTLGGYMSGVIKHIILENYFIKDSLFCEYGYIVNFDSGMFEVWKGFQHEPDPSNRYGQECDRDYYPCKLMYEFSLDDLPIEEVFLKTVLDEEEEEDNEILTISI